MDRIKKLRDEIKEMRESAAEPEDIAILVQELNKELLVKSIDSNKCLA